MKAKYIHIQPSDGNNQLLYIKFLHTSPFHEFAFLRVATIIIPLPLYTAFYLALPFPPHPVKAKDSIFNNYLFISWGMQP
jgi:hypothetical protein